jgi:hypothetical protein
MFQKYGKAITAVVFAVLTAAQVYLGGDNHIDQQEWVQLGIAAASAVGVYVIPLAQQYAWAKTAVAVLLAVLQALATVVLGGLDSNEVLVLVLAALTAIGVGVSPAVSDNGVSSRRPAATR